MPRPLSDLPVLTGVMIEELQELAIRWEIYVGWVGGGCAVAIKWNSAHAGPAMCATSTPATGATCLPTIACLMTWASWKPRQVIFRGTLCCHGAAA